MSAPTPSGSGSTSQPAGASDPSMEDILASIRRILSEDEAPAATATPAPAQAAPPDPEPAPPESDPLESGDADDDKVLSLDTSMLVKEPPSVPAIPALPPPRAPSPFAASPLKAAADELLGPAAAAAASSSVGALMRTLAERQNLSVYRGGPTIEDIVRDEMRPLLKAWLDENLPPLVERLVRAEIERVVGRAIS